VPCPRGDECPPGTACFEDSRCPEFLNPYGTQQQQQPAPVGEVSGPSSESVQEVAALTLSGTAPSPTSAVQNEPPPDIAPPLENKPAPPVSEPAPSPAGWTAGIQQNPFSEQQKEQDDAVLSAEVVDATAEAAVGPPPDPNAPCALCPGGAELDPDVSANFQGRNMGCGEFDGILASNGIKDGSGLCGNYRSQFSGVCCSTGASAGGASGGGGFEGSSSAEGVEDARIPDQQTLNGFDATSWYTESEKSGGSPGSVPVHVPLVFVAALFLLER